MVSASGRGRHICSIFSRWSVKIEDQQRCIAHFSSITCKLNACKSSFILLFWITFGYTYIYTHTYIYIWFSGVLFGLLWSILPHSVVAFLSPISGE